MSTCDTHSIPSTAPSSPLIGAAATEHKEPTTTLPEMPASTPSQMTILDTQREFPVNSNSPICIEEAPEEIGSASPGEERDADRLEVRVDDADSEKRAQSLETGELKLVPPAAAEREFRKLINEGRRGDVIVLVCSGGLIASGGAGLVGLGLPCLSVSICLSVACLFGLLCVSRASGRGTRRAELEWGFDGDLECGLGRQERREIWWERGVEELKGLLGQERRVWAIFAPFILFALLLL
uniref:Uncharacterized protein n=1 Tax=Chromera velia CCMP2878 TaxID=1169474 RepID=A0A0G4I5S8_9ALVE|eukprot:Cvel_58.t1-p1 / transcript=Cvel_58.t1 / gene=Cvel_58 / organism=Chromera_velia_CCMP2878 / gene_product=hypothetical protein / transcript_product=hypothetical protein / location=Cvel_scaffold6:52181-52894(+) / protein_length=238 / sequence_SO=supercontig / SO=protein_coding / is_pseudo=false